MKKTFLLSMASIFAINLWSQETPANFLLIELSDTPIKVSTKLLHPTQFRVGQAEVDEKAKEFENMKDNDLDQYLHDHPCPVVIGPAYKDSPAGTPWITDEQHRANASEDAEKSDKNKYAKLLDSNGDPTMYMKIIFNKSDLSAEDFEAFMTDPNNHLVYLNNLGKPGKFEDLPEHVTGMPDDPFRSLAGFTEDDGYILSGVYFAQFIVADWLRQNLRHDSDNQLYTSADVTDKLTNDKQKLIDKTKQLLHSSAAAGQPWYSATPVQN